MTIIKKKQPKQEITHTSVKKKKRKKEMEGQTRQQKIGRYLGSNAAHWMADNRTKKKEGEMSRSVISNNERGKASVYIHYLIILNPLLRMDVFLEILILT